MRLSIIIPCYNEAKTIEGVLTEVHKAPVEDKEVILVDDGSTDGTRQLVRQRLEHLVDKVIFHDTNRGKGAAIRTGAEMATGDLILIQDADREYSPHDYPKLLAPILRDEADVVYGSRFVGGDSHRVLYFWHSVGNKLLTLISNMFTNLNLTDIEVGYKVFRKDILHKIRIEEDGFGFEPEITAKVAQTRCRVFEVGISYSGRTYEEGKKIRWRDGLYALLCIIKYNLRPWFRRDRSLRP